MGKTAASNAALEVSISFGRFENDSLSWEKWSSFSPNKYLEEVEKCATPGSVAEKKAYFEAHYKKIAARKAELIEQEKQMETGLSRSDANHGQGDLARNAAEGDYVIDAYARGTEQVNYEGRLEQGMEPNEDDLITIECNCFMAERERAQEGPEGSESRPNFDKSQEENVVKEIQQQEVTPTITAAAIDESQSQLQEDASNCGENADEKVDNTTVLPEENSRLNPQRNAQKMVKGSKDRSTPKIRKKLASPLPKLPQVTTPKVSKPIPVSTTSSASRSLTRARTAQSTLRSKNLNRPSTENSKKEARKSLHMPISPSPTSSLASAPTTTRKSLIMESMGDKDIVKRAFKMFQYNVREVDPTGDDKSPITKQVSSSRTERRASHSNVTHKENGGARSGAALQRGPRASLPSIGRRRNEKPRATPQLVKKFQEKPNAKGREEMKRHLKLEEDKVAENKTVRQGHNSKAPSRPASKSQSGPGK